MLMPETWLRCSVLCMDQNFISLIIFAVGAALFWLMSFPSSSCQGLPGCLQEELLVCRQARKIEKKTLKIPVRRLNNAFLSIAIPGRNHIYAYYQQGTADHTSGSQKTVRAFASHRGGV